jgi:hypothetical protein
VEVSLTLTLALDEETADVVVVIEAEGRVGVAECGGAPLAVAMVTSEVEADAATAS